MNQQYNIYQQENENYCNYDNFTIVMMIINNKAIEKNIYQFEVKK